MDSLPEYMDAFGKIDGAFTLEILKVAPIPSDIVELDEEGLKSLWHEAKLRGRGYSRASVNAPSIFPKASIYSGK